jgi:hypothetical protein
MDENLAIIVYREQAPPLHQRNWKTLFLEKRSAWGQEWQVFIFGHALLEKLLRPYPSLTAHCLCVKAEALNWTLVDDTLWQWLVTRHPELQSSNQAETSSQIVRLSTKDLTPLPLMGIPGWWKGNADPCFYEDQTIFRASGARGKIR